MRHDKDTKIKHFACVRNQGNELEISFNAIFRILIINFE